MLSEFEIKNLQTLKKMLDEIKAERDKAEKGLKEIDEKYKTIIEKEKKDLRQTLASCKKEVEFWEKPIVKRYGKPVDELLAKPEEINAEPENADPDDELPFSNDDEKVVDNEAVEEPAEKPAEEQVAEEHEVAGVGFDETGNVVPEETVSEESPAVEQSGAEESVEGWGEEKKAEEKDDEDWPDFPDEWK